MKLVLTALYKGPPPKEKEKVAVPEKRQNKKPMPTGPSKALPKKRNRKPAIKQAKPQTPVPATAEQNPVPPSQAVIQPPEPKVSRSRNHHNLLLPPPTATNTYDLIECSIFPNTLENPISTQKTLLNFF